MRVLNKLVIKNIKLNRARATVTIVGIMLSCALIVGLAGLATSVQQSFIEMGKIHGGNRHVTFNEVPKEELKYIENHKGVEKYSLRDFAGVTPLKNQREMDQLGQEKVQFGEFFVGDEAELRDLKEELIEGSLPKNKDEILVGENFYNEEGKPYKVGDNVELEIGERYPDGHENALDSAGVMEGAESYKKISNDTYKVVGIVKSPYYAVEPFVIGKMTEVPETADISVLYENIKEYDTITAEINGTKSDDEEGKYLVNYNDELLRWSSSGYETATKAGLLASIGIVIGIIILTTVFCIRNSFAISVSEKTRLNGMLSSIGATPKQIKRTVLMEGFFFGIIGIPLGILLGSAGVYVLLYLVNELILSSELNSNAILDPNISFVAILVSVGLAVITIYLSAIGSARKASKATEIENIKSQQFIKIKKKKLRAPKIIGKLFKTEGIIAYKNMKRNRSKFRVTVISLTISIISYLVVSAFMTIGFESAERFYKEVNYSGVINNSNSGNYEEDLKTYEYLGKMPQVSDFSIISEIHSSLYVAGFGYMGSIDVISLNDEAYLEFINKAGISPDEAEDKAIVLANTVDVYKADGEIEREVLIEEDAGIVDIVYYDDSLIENPTEYDEKLEKSVIKLETIFTEERPLGLEFLSLPTIVVSERVFEEITMAGVGAKSLDEGGDPVEIMAGVRGLYVQIDDMLAFEEGFAKYVEKNGLYDFEFWNVEEEAALMNNTVLLTGICLYGFLAIMVLIGLTSVINTITTNIKLRSKEFAILQSIGMTKKEFNNMIKLESFFYGIKSLIFGLPIGLALTYIMYSTYADASITELTFVIHWKECLIATGAVMLVVFMIMKLSMAKVEKQNIIETLRNENI